MHLKTFHAPSIQDAIRQARRELGADAMLLNSRRVTGNEGTPPVFAVTFATTAPPAAPKAAASGTLASRTEPPASGQAGKGALPLHTAVPGATSSSESGAASAPRSRPQAQLHSNESTADSHAVGSHPHAGELPQPPRDDQQPENGVSKAASGVAPLPSYEKLFEQMTSMRREMLQLAGSVRRASAASYRQDLPNDELRWAYDVLVSQDFYPEIIEEVIDQMAPRFAGQPSAEPGTSAKSRRRRRARPEETSPHQGILPLLRETLSSRIELSSEPSLRRRNGTPHLVALVGPPGVGKTTTLVKLAARYGAHSRFPLQIISMDNYRVAASEQLRTYASVLGVGFDALASAALLPKTLRQYEAKEMILIDTPGYGWRDFPAAEDLAAILRQADSASIHLVVSASMKPGDLARVADLYEVFGYHSILFTKVDETATIGPLVSESAVRRKPLSYLCAGQRIPDDLEVASRERILERILPTSLSSGECAA